MQGAGCLRGWPLFSTGRLPADDDDDNNCNHCDVAITYV